MRGLRGLEALDWKSATAASGLDPAVLKSPSSTLSKGMLQRIALLEAVHSQARLLLLDEPFAGLDPDGRDWLATQLHARLDDGAAALITDHSGAAGNRLALAGRIELRDGSARTTAALAKGRTVVASHPDGRRLERDVTDSDDLLRELLAGGWHIEEVRR
jgi:ABC-type nitrate/sulfonate/bicarbonate transport system ATPase subunit